MIPCPLQIGDIVLLSLSAICLIVAVGIGMQNPLRLGADLLKARNNKPIGGFSIGLLYSFMILFTALGFSWAVIAQEQLKTPRCGEIILEGYTEFLLRNFLFRKPGRYHSFTEYQAEYLHAWSFAVCAGCAAVLFLVFAYKVLQLRNKMRSS